MTSVHRHHHDVCLHVRNIDVQARKVSQSTSERLRIGVVIRHPVDHRFESNDAGRRDDAALAQAPADHLAPPARFFNVVAFASQNAPHRARKPL